jgi:hypothetical protein
MSYRRSTPNVLASGALGAAVGLALIASAIALLSLPGLA